MQNKIENKTILVTGGTGSFGQAFVEAALKLKPAKIIVLSRNELAQVEMERKFSPNDYPIRYFLGDIRDRNRLMTAFRGVDIVLHAAALKHIDKGYYNPGEVIKTNVIGTQNVIEAAISCDVDKMLAISTDKAVNPCTIYGSAKLTADFAVIGGNVHAVGRRTKLSAIRFGNFLGSSGSVVPFFRSIKGSGEQPITHPDITRFFIKPDQAINRLFSALDMMQGGEIFTPKMRAIRIADLGKAIDPDAKQVIVGLRPGEKMYEEIMTVEMARTTRETGLFYVKTDMESLDKFPKTQWTSETANRWNLDKLLEV